MTKIKFEVLIEPTDTASIEAACALLRSINRGANPEEQAPEEEKAETKVVEDPPAPTKKKRRTKAEIEAEKAAKELEEKAAKEPTEETKAAKEPTEETKADAPTLTELRAVVKAKIHGGVDKANQGLIRAKLAEVGASNVSTIKPEHYATVIEYLNTLPNG